MAVKSTGTTESKISPPASQPADAAAEDDKPAGRDCVVDAGFHVGRAVPGTVVCSYHTMHYAADGSRRT